jgi:hypothetical protein
MKYLLLPSWYGSAKIFLDTGQAQVGIMGSAFHRLDTRTKSNRFTSFDGPTVFHRQRRKEKMIQ